MISVSVKNTDLKDAISLARTAYGWMQTDLEKRLKLEPGPNFLVALALSEYTDHGRFRKWLLVRRQEGRGELSAISRIHGKLLLTAGCQNWDVQQSTLRTCP